MSNLLDKPFSIAVEMEAFLVGMVADVTSKSEDDFRSNLISVKSLKELSNDIRSAYDAIMPNIHVLDIYRVTDALWHYLVKHPDKIFVGVTSPEGLTDADNKSLRELLAVWLTPAVKASLRDKLDTAISRFHSSLLQKDDPIALLNAKATNIFNELNRIGVTPDTAAAAGAEFSAAIRAVFGKSAILASNNPSLTKDKSYAFISSTFTGAKTRINDILTKTFIDFILGSKNIGLSGAVLGGGGTGYTKGKSKSIATVQVGNLVHFGHTTVKNELGSFLNSPASVKAIYASSKGGSSKYANNPVKAAEVFKKQSGQLKYAFTVDKNLTDIGTAGVLLALGVTITLPWLSTTNTRLGARENKALNTIADKSSTGIDVSSLASNLYKYLGGPRVLKGTSSQSIQQFILNTITSYIKTGKPPKKEVTKKKTIKSKPLTRLVQASPVSINVRALSSYTLQGFSPNPYANTSFGAPNLTTNLASLQSLLDAQLVQRVKDNMGNGSRRDVLNLRSGRLAESAQVERLSESRAGMITAFYSYMKNPYATFSQGGRQQSPRSRDPKSLISKSIREIAATQVGLRLRAVLV
jgi:hypothetical protein